VNRYLYSSTGKVQVLYIVLYYQVAGFGKNIPPDVESGIVAFQ
jgi:hypothetical protein